MKDQPGTPCRLSVNWMEGEAPVEGDFLRTKTGRCYRIDRVTRTRPGSKTWGAFFCTRLERDAVQLGEPGVFLWTFGSRG